MNANPCPRYDVRDLRHTYPDGTPALRGVSFTLAPGEAVALVGANGAGKSTLLLYLSGCLVPPAGSLFVDGEAVTRASLGLVRGRAGMVFQEAEDQLFMPTVRDDAAFGPLNMGLDPAEALALADNALARVGAQHLAGRPGHRLSGGEKRLAALATVLSMNPHSLILDEPTADLDPGARRRFINLMRTFDLTRLVATHDLAMALEICPRALILRAGEIEADGPTETLFRDDALMERCGLERPAGLPPQP